MEIQAKKVLLQNTEGEIVVPVIDPNEVGSGGGWVPSIFQPFWSDHKLNRVDMLRGNTFSWQSGDVYIACYNKLLEEWTDKNADVTLNIDKIRNIVVAKNGVATGFSSGNYLQKAITLGSTKEDVFPIITEFTTGNDVFTAQQILVSDSLAFSIFITNNKLAISLGSNKATYNITNQSKGVTELQVNTNYRAILDYDGTKYTLTLINLDSEDLTPSTELVIESDRLITTEVSKIVVGITLDKQAPFLGSIRVSRLRIGTSYHAQTKCVSSNGFIVVDENHEQDVDNEYKRTGVAWYYIFDEVGKKFKLPRTKYGFVGARDNVGKPVLTNLATGKNATDTQMYLYFYVGEFAQTALEENAGLNVELFNEKADVDLDNLSEEGKNKLGIKTSLITKFDLMKANDKKVQFICSEEAPVTVDFLDGTQKDFSYITDLDLTSKSAGNYNVLVDKQGNSQAPNQYFTADKFANYTLEKGTGTAYPTVDSEGNASGFANRNGMLLPKRFNPADKPWEMQWCFTTSKDTNTRQWLLGEGANIDYVSVMPHIEGNKVKIYLTSNGTSWNITSAIAGTTTLTASTKYWYKVKYDGTQYIGILSTTGEFTGEETTEWTVANTTPIYVEPYPMLIGNSWYNTSNNQPFLGTIHLQDCWIKIDGEYFWQPYTDKPVRDMNFTVNGSPLITNNYEAYLFSSANYITLPKKLPDTFSTLEAVVQYNSRKGAISTTQVIFNLSGKGATYGILLEVNTSKITLYLSSNGTSWDIVNQSKGTTTLLANTDYWFKYVFDGTTHKCYSSTTGKFAGEEVEEVSVTSSVLPKMTSTPALGYAWNSSPCLGSIKVDDCYIKVDGEYFWKPLNEDVILVQNNQTKKFVERTYTDYYGEDIYENVDLSNSLGVVTTDDIITNITNNYQTETINPLQEVTVHTKESYTKVTEDLPTNLDLIPFTFVDIDYGSYETVSADTSYTLTKDVIVNTNSISTFTITKDGATYTVYGTWLPVGAGTMFKSSVAGKYYSFEGY